MEHSMRRNVLDKLNRISVADTYEGKPILYLQEALRYLGRAESDALLSGFSGDAFVFTYVDAPIDEPQRDHWPDDIFQRAAKPLGFTVSWVTDQPMAEVWHHGFYGDEPGSAEAYVASIVTATQDDLTFVKNLVPYYVYDMSEYMGWDPNGEGRYDGCDDLPDYWHKPDHHPYLITADGKIAGFAMVRPYPDEPARHEIGEFFVLRKYRGHGVGRRSACWLFDTHPGKWLVRVLEGNAGALAFWGKVIYDYADGPVVRTTEIYACPVSGTWPMLFYRFESGQHAPAGHHQA